MKNIRNIWKGFTLAAFMMLATVASISAQNSLPAPGAGGSFNPAPIGGAPGPANPGPGFGCGPGCGQWGPSFSGSSWVNNPGWQDQGVTNVIACGYDARGVWRTIPLRVAYVYNGAQYDVTVLAAYNPWTNMWNRGLQQPAYNTYFFINGNYYDFYTVLSTGTFYFNL